MNTELEIVGMTCGHCVAAVTKALLAVPGVENATVDLDAGRAVVHGHANVAVLLSAVEDEGYEARVA